MARLWHQAVSAPDTLQIEFRQLDLKDFLTAKRAAIDALDEGDLQPLSASSWKELAVALGAQLMALDELLAQTPSFVGPPAVDDPFLVPGTELHVIPRSRAKRDMRPGPGAGFRRRATPHHRILPRRIGTHAIETVWRPQLSAPSVRAPTERRFGAALLPGMSLEPPYDPGDWIASSAPCPDDGSLVREQVAGAYENDVFAAVWPELSMPPERLALLSRLLKERSDLMEVGVGPAIVAAGSWHEEKEGQVRNVMRILDRTGQQRLEFFKGSAYAVGPLREGIVPHDVLPVLVNDDALVAFAICLDFCELETTFRYELDVDYVLVASLGNRTTMDGHKANSRRLASRTGGRSFVVQHSDTGIPVGWVLPGADDERPDDLEESRPWSVRAIPPGEL